NVLDRLGSHRLAHEINVCAGVASQIHGAGGIARGNRIANGLKAIVGALGFRRRVDRGAVALVGADESGKLDHGSVGDDAVGAGQDVVRALLLLAGGNDRTAVFATLDRLTRALDLIGRLAQVRAKLDAGC